MISICLCDDDINILNYYSDRISNLLEKSNYIFKIKTFKSGENLIFEVMDNPNDFNIIIIDIIMKNINGVETAKILREHGYKGIIIFLTSSKEFALDSFKVEPLNYILKNENYERFDYILFKAISEVYKNRNKNIILSSKYENKIINLDSILYMESMHKKVILHKISGEIEEISGVFKDIYEKIKGDGFIRCHKSYIVNKKYIQKFNKLECRLQNGITIPIGRKYGKDFRKILIEDEFNNIII